MAAFYAMLIAQLAYEIWQAPLVDDETETFRRAQYTALSS
jgi:hypothetical protein